MSQDTNQRFEAAKRLALDMQARVDRAHGRLESAKKQYTDLVARAKQSYGVSTLTELEDLVRKTEQENTLLLNDFDLKAVAVKAELDAIERALEAANV